MKMGAYQMVDSIWNGLVSHVRKGHRLRLVVDDYGHSIRCIYCGCELVEGSQGMMTALCGRLRESGVEFEVLCQTVVQG